MTHPFSEAAPLTDFGQDPRDQAGFHFDLLTRRERQVASLVSDGLGNKEIASKLSITERTVKAHLSSAFQKLNVSNRLRLSLFLAELARSTGHSGSGNGVSDEANQFSLLSRRESQTAHLVFGGLSNREIAFRLKITEKTVKAHLSSIFQKLNISGRIQLALSVAKSAGPSYTSRSH